MSEILKLKTVDLFLYEISVQVIKFELSICELEQMPNGTEEFENV